MSGANLQKMEEAMRYLLLLLATVGAVFAGSASADPVGCAMSCPDNSPGSSCVQSCTAWSGDSSGGGGARHVRKYAAIAISDTQLLWGNSYNAASRKEAEEAALTYCYSNASKPKDCKVAVWFYDACGSLAIKANTLTDGKNNGAWGADWASSKKGAEKKALKLCQKYGGDACKPAVTFCAAQ